MMQSSRLILTIVYVALLIILSRIINGAWFYWPTGDRSLWFQAGLLMVVLGSFFIEKHFTKPVDVVTNCMAGIITMLAVDHREHFLFWSIALSGMAALVAIALISMSFSRQSSRR